MPHFEVGNLAKLLHRISAQMANGPRRMPQPTCPMRPKSLLVDLGSFPDFVCRTCLALRKPGLNLPAPRYYSRATRTSRPLPRPARKAQQVQQVQIPRVDIPEPETDDGNDVTFRYFEMDRPGHLRPLKDHAEFVASLESEERRAQAELDKMEAQLKLSAFKGLRELAENLGLVPKQAEHEVVQKEQPKYKPFTHSVDSSGLYTRHVRPIIELNQHLKRTARKLALGKIGQKSIHDTWKLYSLARPLLQNSWQRVPPEVWQLLWRLLSWDGPENTNRMGRVYRLGKDMRAAGVPMDDTRQVLLIEATFVEGLRKEALEAWKRFPLTPEHSDEFREEYLKLGVRMYSMHGDLDRAGRALDKLLETKPSSDPRFMLSFIRACAQDKTRLDKAWETYRRMRELLGPDIKIEDYDEVVASFLLSKQTDWAFKVFVDMMFSGAIDLHGKTRLPSAVGNHFFMGKWLKRLIGAGNLDGALEVLRFMQTKGILAAKIQVNGLIGAWLRSGLAENLEKADKLAWAMVRSRLKFVELRRREALVDWPIRLLQTPNKSEDLPDSLGLTFVPQASLETFSLMAENYKERRLHSRLEGLWVAFQKCEMSTDAFMMNQLLESYVQEGLGTKAREVYKALTEEHALAPDAYTFFALYQSLAVNNMYWPSVTDEIKRGEAHICRALFRDMVGSSWTFESEEVQQALMRTVLHTFRKCNDNVGVLIALRAMRDVFHWPPGHAVSMEMLAENPDLAQSKKKLFEASRKVQAAYDISLRGGSDGATPARRELSQKEGAEILTRMVEEHYVQKVGATSDEELELMYQAAILEMGLADILLPSQAPGENQQEDGAGSVPNGAAVSG